MCGPDDEVIKFMPPINISEKDLLQGVQIVKEAIDEVASSMKHNFLEGRLLKTLFIFKNKCLYDVLLIPKLLAQKMIDAGEFFLNTKDTIIRAYMVL